MAFEVEAAEAAAAVVGVFDAGRDACAGLAHSGVQRVSVVRHPVDGLRLRAAELARQLHVHTVAVARRVFRPGRAPHHRAAAERELRMGDAAAFVGHHEARREAEDAAQPVDGGRCVAVAHAGDRARIARAALAVGRGDGHSSLLRRG